MEKLEVQEPKKEHINRFKMAHMVGVAEYMRDRAEDYEINPNEAYVIGLLHDIGYLEGREDHERSGAELLGGMGFKHEITTAIRFHGDNPYQTRIDFFGDEAFVSREFILLLEADMSVDSRGFRVGFDKRLEDIAKRYGEDNIAYATAKDNISFVKQYQKEYGVKKPNFYKKHRHTQPER